MKESTRNYMYIAMLILTLFSLAFSFCAWNMLQEQQEQQLLKDQIVYITKNGEKYHRKTCRYLDNSIITTTLFDAKLNGYQPCSECIGKGE